MTETQPAAPPETTIDETMDDLVDDLAFFDDWQDKYQQIIHMGRALPAFPEPWKTAEHEVHGCMARVWMKGRWQDDRLRLYATSNAIIVSGLIAMLLKVYDNRTAEEILSHPPTFIERIGMDSHFSQQRSTGLAAMKNAIFEIARQGPADGSQGMGTGSQAPGAGNREPGAEEVGRAE